MPTASPERQMIHPRTGSHFVRDVLAVISLTAGLLLGAWAVLASQSGLVGLSWQLTWVTLGAAGLALIVSGVGLWWARRWASYTLALIGFAAAAAALVVASGTAARSIRLALGGPTIPIIIAVASLALGASALWLARQNRLAGMAPMSSARAVAIGLVGTVALAVLLTIALRAAGPMSSLQRIAVLGGIAVPCGVLLTYGAHRLLTDGSKWAALLAALAFSVVVVASVPTAAWVIAHGIPSRADPPAAGQKAEVGVPYGVAVWCGLPIELGGLWWSFGAADAPWPSDADDSPPLPFGMSADVFQPSPVLGTVTLLNADHAVFRADASGAEFPLTAVATSPGPGGCM